MVFACEVEHEPLEASDEAVGIDLGLLHFATLSDGSTRENPRYYRKAEKRLERLQPALSRKKRGSHRRKKAVKQVAKAHREVADQRKDFVHKASHQLVNFYGLVVFEELHPATMRKRPKPKQDDQGKKRAQYGVYRTVECYVAGATGKSHPEESARGLTLRDVAARHVLDWLDLRFVVCPSGME